MKYLLLTLLIVSLCFGRNKTSGDSLFFRVVKSDTSYTPVEKLKIKFLDTIILNNLIDTSRFMYLNSTNRCITKLIAPMDVVKRYKTPDSLAASAGTPTGTVTGVQTVNDGVIYKLQEAAATPGQNVIFYINGVTHFENLKVKMYYVGTTSHGIRIQLYNYNTTAYVTITTCNTGIDYEQFILDIENHANYISSGQVRVRLYHTEAGNPSHNTYVDYVGVIY